MSDQPADAKLECEDSCPADATVEAIGGRWKIFILWHLFQGTLRFSELRRKVTGISQKMLTEQLRELEGHGLVTRKIYAEVPPRVEYTATELGKSLRPVIVAMGDWGRAYGDKLTGRAGG